MVNLGKKFSKIYDKNVEKIYRFVFLKVNSRQKAEDITSQVFTKGWEFFKTEDKKIKNPSAFLYQIARNLIVDFYRKKGKIQVVSTEEAKQMSDPSVDLTEAAKIDSEVRLVKECLQNLKEDYKDVIILRYLDDLSTEEVAQIMNKSRGAVRVMLHRALKVLRKEVEES